MYQNIEINKVAIPSESYNKKVNCVVDALLLIDQKMFPSKSLSNSQEVA